MAFDIDEVFPWELAQKWVIRMQQLERAGFFEGDEYDLIIKHGQHNQKTHGSRYGAGQAKESLRRLKDDKTARERYKTEARKRGKPGYLPKGQGKKIGRGSFIKQKGTSFTGIVTGLGSIKAGKKDIPAYGVLDARGRKDAIPVKDAELISN